MSTKSHFIYQDGIEGFEETSEPNSIWGKIWGDAVDYFSWEDDPDNYIEIKLKGGHFITKQIFDILTKYEKEHNEQS